MDFEKVPPPIKLLWVLPRAFANVTNVGVMQNDSEDDYRTVVEASVTVNNNSPTQDYVHPDDETQPTFEMTPGFKPFTVSLSKNYCLARIHLASSKIIFNTRLNWLNSSIMFFRKAFLHPKMFQLFNRIIFIAFLA